MKLICALFTTIFAINIFAIELTKEEKDYIAAHPIIKVHNEQNWAPFNFNEDGVAKGLSIDYMNLVAQKTGLKVSYITGPSWNEFLEMMKDKRLDVMLNIIKNDEREKFLRFTSHYQEAPYGIIVNKDSTKKITNIQELVNSKIAIEEGFFKHNYLAKNYPNAQLVLKKDTLGALQAVSYGEADATFGILPIENYIIQKNGLNNLKIIGVADSDLFAPKKLCMAVSIDNPVLQGILQKGINAVTSDEKTEIYKRWVNVELKGGIDYRLLAKILGAVSLIIGGTLYWVLRLKRLQHKLESSHLLMKTMLDALPNPVFYKDKDARFVGFNRAYEEAFGVDSKELIGKSVLDLEFLLEKDREIYQAEDLEVINSASRIVREQDMVLADKKIHHTVYSVNGFKDSKDRPAGLIGLFVDITEQKESEAKLQKMMNETAELHQRVNDSIAYAAMIQSVLISLPKVLEGYFSDSFAVWQPKDTVGGDIYMFEEISKDECLLFVVDCTGHGVPGAFVTVIVKAIERNIVAKLSHDKEQIHPSHLLSVFNRSIKNILKQDSKNSLSNVGFDGTILYYNKSSKILRFASVQNPVMYIKGDNITEYKGDRHSVGCRTIDENYVFTEHELKVEDGDRFFISTDGLYDQNGGEKDLPMGRKRIAKIFVDNKDEPLNEIKEMILYELGGYQGANKRDDDIAFVSFTI